MVKYSDDMRVICKYDTVKALSSSTRSQFQAAASSMSNAMGRARAGLTTAHLGKRNSESDWQLFIGHLNATLAHLEFGDTEKNDVVAFIMSLKGNTADHRARRSIDSEIAGHGGRRERKSPDTDES